METIDRPMGRLPMLARAAVRTEFRYKFVRVRTKR